MKTFQLGFAPKDSLIRSAEKKGISKEQLVSAGLVTKTERGNYFEYMSDRVVFPIFDSQGRVIAFGGRTLKDDDPKYLNTPETSVYSKSQQLYGLFQALPALRKTNEVIVLEGYIDVIVSHQFGLSTSVATLGTSLTAQHSHILKRYCENVILLFDSDKAGNEATKRAIETLLDSEISIKTASLPAGIDLDEYLLKEGKESFSNLLEKEKKSFIDFMIKDAIDKFGVQTVESKVKAVNDILPFVAKIKNLILRSEAIKHVSEKINVREDAVISELRRLVKKAPLKSEFQESGAQQKHTRLRNAEEEIMQLILAHPECISDLDQELLKEERTKKIFNFLKDGVSVPEIIEELEEQDRVWFREILLEEKEYTFPDQTLSNLTKDIRNKELENTRQELEKEIIMMRNGTIPYDNKKFELFKELTIQLKGSGK
ncbi:MAG: toprim domain-containing protein [Elusimicrobia bacterium]|nr:toprim domain-containing protein [Elusimicrobiota bacterium]